MDAVRFAKIGDSSFHIAWKDGGRVFCRGWHKGPDGSLVAILAVRPASEHPHPAIIDRLAHEYGWKDELDRAWAVCPLDFLHEGGQTVLLLEDPGGEPLTASSGVPIGVESFLRLAIAIAVAVGKLHERGLVHKDIKPQNIIVDHARGEIRLTGFGIASRLRRERQAIQPPETIAGTLAYMAPEQTGWMNRSIDSRSDLYALGVTLYEMLTGSLPFAASDPMEWVHCHIARKPAPPTDRVGSIPSALSMIIMKLLAKTAEDRYQTAGGLVRDLRRCLAELEDRGQIGEFPLGQHDTSDRLTIPERLYGREREIETLLASFDRVVEGGTPELVLVSGYSGIGKSSVVNELHKVLVPPRALFASGKFDQYKREIPYSTLAQALRALIRLLLGKSDAELAGWREAFHEALGDNGQLVVDLVPELNLIIGDQPPVPVLSPRDAQYRFQRVFRRFIGVFAQPEHPLALFLDDLQWLDAATLDLIENLLTQSGLNHLMLIGAYRDNEVDASHPLMRKIEAIRQTGARVQQIQLGPLGHEHLRELIADAIRRAPQPASQLANLVQEKTAGNPFFAIQFLHMLDDEGLLTFDVDQGRWSWDLERLHAKRYTDNVADLMAARLVRRPEKTQQALQQFACLGAVADTTTLAIVLETSPDQIHSIFWDALSQELVERRGDSYHFTHDRVQEAAYSMIPETSRADSHLRIGRLLTERMPAEQREEAIFEIVSQFNRGAALISLREEREQVAQLNLVAGKRAKASTAYASALSYLNAGMELLAEEAWERRQELVFELEQHRADCELCTGALQNAEERLATLATRAVGTLQRCAVAHRRTHLYMMLGANERAVAVALECLRHVGIDWSAHPTEAEMRHEYERFWSQLGNRTIEDLVDLPIMQDPEALATLGVLTGLGSPACYTDLNLFTLSVCKATCLSLDLGNSDAAPYNYEDMSLIASTRFGHYDQAYRLGKMACDLLERRGWHHYGGRTYFVFASHLPSTRPLRDAIDPARRAFEMAQEHGDPAFAAMASRALNSVFLATGHPLDQVELDAEHGLEFSRHFGFYQDRISAPLALVRTLRGETTKFGSLDDGRFNELAFEERTTGRPVQPFQECYYWIRKLQARFFAGDYVSAINAAERVEEWYMNLPSLSLFMLEEEEYHFYAALARAALCESQPYEEYREALGHHQRRLRGWAANCPQNFEDRAALIDAEIARIEGRPLEAMELYKRSIMSARDNGFVHNEGLACELAARFYAARGFDINSYAHLRKARQCYESWGADGKVRQLDQLFPFLKDKETALIATDTIGAPVERLDLTTIIKVSQAVSSEIVHEKLIDTLMRTAIEQAGAERGLLILAQGATPRIAAEATTGDDKVVVHLRDDAATGTVLPESVLRYVLHSRESVILDDAATQSQYAADLYIRARRARSVVCLPLVNQGKLVGALYFENGLAPNVFAPARMTVLKLLASQAAISLENSRLYGDLQEQEAKVRRLVDANIIGIVIWDFEGRIIEANDTYLRMLGFDREDFVCGRVHWTDLIPPEWRDRTAPVLEDIKTTGTIQPFETEYLRKDGGRVPVLIGAARLERNENQGVAFVLDLTERRRAESEARNNERRYRETQAELAHANRVATMGQLTASIAHEVNQPITAMMGNAEATLRWLARQPPDLQEARQLLERIVKDGRRVGNVVERTRGLVKKAPLRMERIEINGVVGEVIELTHGETVRSHVSVRTQLAKGLPLVEADRIQIQQVVLNLIINAVHALEEVGQARRELLISSSKNGSDGVLISVRDTGKGTDLEQLEKLFDPFYTTKPGGMGMGLSICRSIIEGHGGKIWAEANLPQGAVFHFTISPARQY
ncbi:AAA family ATPase [Bradyrhizobium sp. UFLA05-109]